jgi:hypothetical protein
MPALCLQHLPVAKPFDQALPQSCHSVEHISHTQQGGACLELRRCRGAALNVTSGAFMHSALPCTAQCPANTAHCASVVWCMCCAYRLCNINLPVRTDCQ